MSVEIDIDVPLVPSAVTAFVCRQRGPKPTITRKFIAECGTKIIVDVGSRGGINKMGPESICHNGKDCASCKDRMGKIRLLIESGK